MAGYSDQINKKAEELSFPSLVPSGKTYQQQEPVTMQGGISIVNGVAVLNGIVREFNNV